MRCAAAVSSLAVAARRLLFDRGDRVCRLPVETARSSSSLLESVMTDDDEGGVRCRREVGSDALSLRRRLRVTADNESKSAERDGGGSTSS